MSVQASATDADMEAAEIAVAEALSAKAEASECQDEIRCLPEVLHLAMFRLML